MDDQGLALKDNTAEMRGADSHGEAALLLVESLIHGLVSTDVMSVTDAVEVVEIALESHIDIQAEQDSQPISPEGTAALLQAIEASLRHDLPEHD